MDKYGILFDIIDKINKSRELLRRDKLIGKNQESLAIVEYHGGARSAPVDVSLLIFDERLLSSWAGGPVWINVLHPKCDDSQPLAYDVHVTAIRDDPSWAFCPRCWGAHRDVQNHDRLCLRCLRLLSQAFPQYLPAEVVALNTKESDKPVGV